MYSLWYVQINKLREIKQILGDTFQIFSQNINISEIQGSTTQIAKYKALSAYSKLQKPIIVQDTSLCFNAYKGLPGPYIKWFLQSLGPEGLAKMVDPFQDKTAYALCTISYMNKNLQNPQIFMGRNDGRIVRPRGNPTFGWDPVFQPNGSQLTYAQMTSEEKNKISHRYRALQEMKKYFGSEGFLENIL